MAAKKQDVTVQNGADDREIMGKSEDNGVAPASEFDPSGAPRQVVGDVDPSHPAVDSDPRAATSADQNRIDFNDPTINGSEAVDRNLKAQSKGAEAAEGETQTKD